MALPEFNAPPAEGYYRCKAENGEPVAATDMTAEFRYNEDRSICVAKVYSGTVAGWEKVAEADFLSMVN